MKICVFFTIFFLLLIIGFSSVSVAADSSPTRRTCKVMLPPVSERSMPRTAAQSDCTSWQTVIRSEYYSTVDTYTIPVIFHNIHKVDLTGYISDATFAAQIQALNDDYRAMAGTLGSDGYDVRIQFTLDRIIRWPNDTWFNASSSTAGQQSFKTPTIIDPQNYLNIWTQAADGLLGYAYLAQDADWAIANDLDGVVLYYEATSGRGGSLALYDQGRTAVHEVGHYLGLHHTFGGCTDGYTSGDLIVDTPPESNPAYDCVAKYDCGSADDIRNYMNYTPDSCMTHFTQEQANRMVCSLINYRPQLYTKSTEVMSNSVAPVFEVLLLDD